MKDRSNFLEAVLLGSKQKAQQTLGEGWHQLTTKSKIIFSNYPDNAPGLDCIIMSDDEFNGLPEDVRLELGAVRSSAQSVVVSFDDNIAPRLFYLCATALRQTIETFLAADAPDFIVYERPNRTSSSSLVASISKDSGRLLLVSSDDSSQAFICLLKKNIILAIDFQKEELKSFPVTVVTSFN